MAKKFHYQLQYRMTAIMAFTVAAENAGEAERIGEDIMNGGSLLDPRFAEISTEHQLAAVENKDLLGWD